MPLSIYKIHDFKIRAFHFSEVMLIYQKYVDVCPADSAVWQESKCGCDQFDEKYASPFYGDTRSTLPIYPTDWCNP